MHLKCHRRFKDGKEHRYWSIVESRRCSAQRIVQRHVLYLGEINDSQKETWLKCIEVFDAKSQQQVRLALFPADRALPEHAVDCGVQVRLRDFFIRHPRQWGACWLFLELWRELHLDRFWKERLPDSREGTCWVHVLTVLCAYRLISPGSEWRLHREWFDKSAMADLLGEDFALAAKDTLYRCLDKLLAHKEALFGFLKERWQGLFGIAYDVLLYDLTSTYFESDPPFGETDKRQFGYSRDKRFDCVQVVIALVVTPEGFPLAYEVLPGNTADKTTLKMFLEKIESLYGKARRIWVMDRGIPTEEVLAQMRQSDPPILYIVGTPKGRLSKLESQLVDKPWQDVRAGVQVKLLPDSGERYILAQSVDRVNKERAMRRRQLKWLWGRLKELRQMKKLTRDGLLLKLGAAQQRSPSAWRLVALRLPQAQEEVSLETFTFRLRKRKLRQVRRREGRYLLRTNLPEEDPGKAWQFYMQLSQVEEAFQNLKGDLAVRPIYHQLEHRIEAHIFVSFLAYCVHVSLREKARRLAPGLSARSVLEKFGTMQMLDVHFPTTDGRELVFRRYTQPEADQKLLLEQLNLTLPEQSPPRLSAKQELEM
jgi:transposase